jgi:hypothetical protein
MQYLRIDQSRFANEVLHNCGDACIFCGRTFGDGARQPSCVPGASSRGRTPWGSSAST